MKHARCLCLFALLTTFLLSQSNRFPVFNPTASFVPPGIVSSTGASQPDPKAQATVLDSYGKLPLSFEANRGQADAQVKFLSRTGAYTLFLTADEAVLTWRAPSGATEQAAEKRRFVSGYRFSDTRSSSKSGTPLGAGPWAVSTPATKSKTNSVLRMKLRNANPAARVTGMEELAGASNYFIGNDPTKWRTNVPTYAKVKCEGIYSGIDLVYYGNQRQLEYDFIVAPGADPRRIAFDVHGAKRIRRDAHGDLVFKVGENEIRWHKPAVYQEKDGAKQEIAARYAISDANRLGFEVSDYDASRPLYIDPLIYSTYLGGSGYDAGYGIAVDSAGNAYVTGGTSSTDFPTMNPLQPANGGAYDVFVSKINPSGSTLVYSTYLGGSSGDIGYGIAVDSAGDAYVVGQTASPDFPTVNPLQPTFGGVGDAFVAKINATGSGLVYSTYLGGNNVDSGNSIAVDSAGNAYVTGSATSTDFPTTPGAFQTVCNNHCGGGDAYVAKITPTGSALAYSTLLGGNSTEYSQSIAVDSAGNAYIVGFTDSTDFPTTPGAFQRVCNHGSGCGDAFVAKLNPTGSALVYSTYLGGSRLDYGNGIAVDGTGNAYVTGYTTSTDFPIMNPFQATKRGRGDVFVAKLNPTGSALVYSTYLGRAGNDFGSAVAVDNAGNAYIAGGTHSGFFPTKNPLQAKGGSYDGFVAKLNPPGSALVFSTFLGGSGDDSVGSIAVDSTGNAYVTGRTSSTNFPVTSDALQTKCDGDCVHSPDAFVAKLYLEAGTATTISSSLNPSTHGQVVTFTAVVTSGLGAPPDGETVTFMRGTSVLGTAVLSGGLAYFATSTLPGGISFISSAYAGDSNFAASKSKAVKQVVN
jgi:Bacterial Ig-like domain (group 3)/Beta-propeller repeat